MLNSFASSDASGSAAGFLCTGATRWRLDFGPACSASSSVKNISSELAILRTAGRASVRLVWSQYELRMRRIRISVNKIERISRYMPSVSYFPSDSSAVFRPTFSYFPSDSLAVFRPTFSYFPSDSLAVFRPTYFLLLSEAMAKREGAKGRVLRIAEC